MRYKLSLDDMFKQFPHFSHNQKMAIAFSVYVNIDVSKTVNLRWCDTIELNWRAELILSKLQLSDSVAYIFWSCVDGNDERLVSLPILVSGSIGTSGWSSFSNAYKYSIPIEFSRAYL